MTASLELKSTVTAAGDLEISLLETALPVPAENDVLIRVDATPINPSDLGLLFAAADISQARNIERDGRSVLTAPIAAQLRPTLAARVDQALAVGNEGAGVVIAAGTAAHAQALLGKTVAVLAGGMYAQYRSVPAASCLVLADDVTARDGASCFVNPLTALGMTETMKLEGHGALVHTAAASNLGQMLNRLCQADNIGLVNIVRSAAQADLLRAAGAVHVCDSSSEDFTDTLYAALESTSATLAFDAIGGGALASHILSTMEKVQNRNPRPGDRYGSTVHKQVYLYGVLDSTATVLDRTYGMAWGVGGWLLPNFLARIGADAADTMRARVAREIKTTFASTYTQAITLNEALDVAIARRYQRKSTGEKFLITPHGTT